MSRDINISNSTTLKKDKKRVDKKKIKCKAMLCIWFSFCKLFFFWLRTINPLKCFKNDAITRINLKIEGKSLDNRNVLITNGQILSFKSNPNSGTWIKLEESATVHRGRCVSGCWEQIQLIPVPQFWKGTLNRGAIFHYLRPSSYKYPKNHRESDYNRSLPFLSKIPAGILDKNGRERL